MWWDLKEGYVWGGYKELCGAVEGLSLGRVVELIVMPSIVYRRGTGRIHKLGMNRSCGGVLVVRGINLWVVLLSSGKREGICGELVWHRRWLCDWYSEHRRNRYTRCVC